MTYHVILSHGMNENLYYSLVTVQTNLKKDRCLTCSKSRESSLAELYTPHIHSIQGRSVITFESLYVHREKQPDTTEVKTALEKFIFEDAKTLRHKSILLHPTADCLNSHFIKLTKWLKSPFVLASRTVSVRTSVRPCFHTTKNLANAATGFLKTGQYPNFLRAPKGR